MGKYLSLVFALTSLGLTEGQWVVQDNPFSGNDSIVFSDVQAVDSLHVWVVGSQDLSLLVLWTSDGGKNWEAKGLYGQNVYSSQTTLNWLIGPGIKFIDTLRGWICVGKTLFTTRDGGGTWVDTFLMDPNSRVVFTDIEFVDSLNGWIVSEGFSGGLPLILHSSDGGKNWQIQDSLSAECDLRGVCFLDSLKGFVVGDSGTLFKTTDGGEHWTKIETGTTKNFMDVQFADSLHGIATGETDFWTKDGDKTWTEGSGGAWDVAFPDSSHAWELFWFSSDGGITWKFYDPGSGIPVVVYYGISFPDSTHGWACGEYGTIIHYNLKTGIEETFKGKPMINQLNIRPNPFGQTTAINYQIASRSLVTIKLYNAVGRLTKSLVNATKPAGSYKIYWDGENDFGQWLPNGVYFCQLEVAGKGKITKKLVLMK